MVLFKEPESAGAGNYLSPIWIPSVKGIVRGKRAVRIYYYSHWDFSLTIPYTLNIYAWDDQLVIHIGLHHVIVRQYKSSTESVSFEHLRICHRKGRTALKFFGNQNLPPLGYDTSGPSFAALYLWLKIIYPQSEFPQSKVLCGESEQWEYITIHGFCSLGVCNLYWSMPLDDLNENTPIVFTMHGQTFLLWSST
jgi:hypothetical protein